jgi:2-methylcitrate dehydratase PrpD
VTITLEDGQVLEKYVGYPLGHAQNPFGDAELEAKFAALAAPHLDGAQVAEAIEATWTLEESSDVSGLMQSLVAGPRGVAVDGSSKS